MTIEMLAYWNGFTARSIQSFLTEEENRLIGLGLARAFVAPPPTVDPGQSQGTAIASNSAPLPAASVASAGAATEFARADHVHPTDPSKADAAHTHVASNIAGFASAAAAAAPVQSFNGRTGAIVPTKADVGLSSVDNTSDLDKPVSNAQALAISAKAALGNTGGANIAALASAGTASTAARSDHVHAHGAQAGGDLHAVATSSADGFMSKDHVSKLAGISDGATANASNADLRDRSTHTGTQSVDTLGDATAAGRAILKAADVAAQRTALGLSAAATTQAATGATSSAAGIAGIVNVAPQAGDDDRFLSGDLSFKNPVEYFSPSAIYKAGQLVEHRGVMLRVIADRAAGSFNMSGFVPITGVESPAAYKGAWTNNTAYAVGDVVYRFATDVVLLKCQTAHTSAATGTHDANVNTNGGPDVDKWLIVQGYTDLQRSGQMYGATATAGGRRGWVPPPVAGDQTKYLRGDGVWNDILAGVSSVRFGLWRNSGNIFAQEFSSGGGVTSVINTTGVTYTAGSGNTTGFRLKAGKSYVLLATCHVNFNDPGGFANICWRNASDASATTAPWVNLATSTADLVSCTAYVKPQNTTTQESADAVCVSAVTVGPSDIYVKLYALAWGGISNYGATNCYLIMEQS